MRNFVSFICKLAVSLEQKNTENIMKKIILLVIILIFCFVIYNSKKDFYEKSEEFYRKSFSGEIKKIIEGRGTKVYYENDSYFYEEDY